MADAEQFERVVYDALANWGLSSSTVSLIKATNNVVYQVVHTGERYALRLHRQGSRKLAWIEAELTWLKAIRRDTDLRVPEPTAPIYQGSFKGSPIYCTLLSWVDGEQVSPASISLEQARKTGTFAARLHNHSIGFTVPSGFELPRLDWNGMFGENSPYYSAEAQDLFTADQFDVLSKIADAAQNVMQNLDHEEGNFGFIHADLIWKNILFDGENIGVIDFDDCVYGYYLYDLAPALLGYMDEPKYSRIRQSMWQGYTSIRPFPASYDSYLDTLIAGRYALSCWWIAAHSNDPAIADRAPEIIAYRIGELRRYLDTGKLRRGEIIV